MIVKVSDIPTPRTLKQAQNISEFLFAELDDWTAREYAKAQDQFEHAYEVLNQDWRGEMYTLMEEMPDMPLAWYAQKIRWLLRSRGEIFLRIQEERNTEIHRIQMETIDAISLQWERWIREISTIDLSFPPPAPARAGTDGGEGQGEGIPDL